MWRTQKNVAHSLLAATHLLHCSKVTIRLVQVLRSCPAEKGVHQQAVLMQSQLAK